MPTGGFSLSALRLTRAALLAASGAVCAVCVAQPVEPITFLTVAPGQSATEIALDQVPPGTTIDQFLLALYRGNPQAFASGDLHRLLSQSRLRLPSADEANRVPLAQAREQVRQILQSPSNAAGAQPLPAAKGEPDAAPHPSTRSGAGTAPTASEAAPPSDTEAAAAKNAAPSEAIALPHDSVKPSTLAITAGVVLALLAAVFWRLRRRAGNAKRPPPQAISESLEDQAQGRFQPVLPEPLSVGARPSGRSVDANNASLPDTNRPEGRAPTGEDHQALTEESGLKEREPATGASKPALFDLDLSLDGPAPPLDLKLTASPKPTTLNSTPRAATGPLDLDGLSLDLDAPTKPAAASPLNLGGLPLDLEAPPKAAAPGPLDLSRISLDLDLPKTKTKGQP